MNIFLTVQANLPLCDPLGMKCYDQFVSNAKDTCLKSCEGIYAVVHVDTSNQTLPLHEDVDDEDFKTFAKEYLEYKRGNGNNFEYFFQNISQSPKWPFLNEQAVQFEIGQDYNLHKAYRHEQRLQLIELYFSAATFEKITRDARIDFITKISLIGGMLGLFTGFSFISLTEILYFSLKFCCAFTKLRSTKRRQTFRDIERQDI